MPPKENAPAAPEGQNNVPKKPGEIRLDSILLPKKDPPRTERVNAGLLLEQEQSATLAASKPEAVSTPAPKEQPIVQPLQTYKGDIEHLIQGKNVSMVQIAAAEAEKRAHIQTTVEPDRDSASLGVFVKKFLMIVGGLALIAAAGGLGVFVYWNSTATVSIVEEAPAPFIQVDNTTVVSIQQMDLERIPLMEHLKTAEEDSTVPLGLIDRLLPVSTVTQETGEVQTIIPAALFLPALVPNVPEELVRTLSKEFLLGIHMFDGPQAFLILQTDSYEQAFAAMLKWEHTLKGDLSPLFNRIPRPRIQNEVATSTTATSTLVVATGFIDKIVENRDTRSVVNEVGDLLLLWTFLDRSTLVITTNEYTLREIVARLNVPVTPEP